MNAVQLIENIENLSPFIVDLALRGGALSLLGLAIYATLRKASPAARHGTLLAAAVGMIALPLLSLAPKWGVLPAPVEAQPSADVEVATPTPTPFATPPAVTAEPVVAATETAAPAASLSNEAPLSFSWQLAVGAAWLFGVVMFGMAIVAGHIAVRFAQRRCRVVREGAVFEALRSACDEYGLGWLPRLLLSDRHAMPMTWGLWRATIVLPAEAERWDADRLRIVMLHELAHVGRRDNLSLFIAQAARALHWFNPLVWWINHRLVLEREQACDDRVVNAGQRPADYAEHLLQIAAHWQDRSAVPHAAIAMARKSQLEGRLVGILSPRNRRALTRGAVLAVALIALAIVVPVGIVGPRQTADARPYGSTEPQDPAMLAVVEKLAGAWVTDTDRSKNFGHVRRLVISPDGSITRYEWPDNKTQAEAQRFNDRYTLADLDQLRVTGPWGEQQFKLRVQSDGQRMMWLATDTRFVFTRIVEAVPPAYVGSWDVSNNDVMTIHANGMVIVKYGNGSPPMNGWIKHPERKLITGPDGDLKHVDPGYRFLIVGPDGDPQYAIDAVDDQLRIANPQNTEEPALVSRVTREHVPGSVSRKQPQPSYVGAWRFGNEGVIEFALDGTVTVYDGGEPQGHATIEERDGRLIMSGEGQRFAVEVTGDRMRCTEIGGDGDEYRLTRIKPDVRYVGVWETVAITSELITEVYLNLKPNGTFTMLCEGHGSADTPGRGIWSHHNGEFLLVSTSGKVKVKTAILLGDHLRLTLEPDGQVVKLRHIKPVRPVKPVAPVDPPDPFAGDRHPMYRADMTFERPSNGVMIDLETGQTISYEQWETQLDAKARRAYDLHFAGFNMHLPPDAEQAMMHFQEADDIAHAGRLAIKFIESLRMSQSKRTDGNTGGFYIAVLTDRGHLAIVNSHLRGKLATTCQWSLGKITDLPNGSIAVTPIELVKPKPEDAARDE